MAHEVDTMAFQGQTPWHGLGNQIPAEAPLDDWITAAGFDWHIRPMELFAQSLPESEAAEDEEASEATAPEWLHVPDRIALVRSDNGFVLSSVSRRYKVVQPSEVAEFFREFTELAGYQMETMGVLRQGRTYWGLARVGAGFNLGTKANPDEVNPYVLLATSCDGSMATVAHLTSVRVVCQNTLQLSVGAGGAKAAVRIPHLQKFDPDAVKEQLGLVPEWWNEYHGIAKKAAKVAVERDEMVAMLARIHQPSAAELLDNSSIITALQDETWELTDNDREDPELVRLFTNRKWLNRMAHVTETGPGQQLKTAKGTLWGVVGGVTRYWDHETRENVLGSRLYNSWFAGGSGFKTAAYEMARSVVNA